MLTEEAVYTMPEVMVGSDVLVWGNLDEANGDPEGRKAALGRVVGCGAQHCDIWAVVPKARDEGYDQDIFYDCWHVTDPRCKTHRELLMRETSRGVWQLAEPEKRRRHFEKQLCGHLYRASEAQTKTDRRLDGLEETTEQLQKQVAKLQVAKPARAN